MPAKANRKKSKAAAPRERRGYGGLTSEQMDGERRQRLLDTALELFAQQGYQRTPIEQLCAESRVTSRYFYQLFDSREALLAALYEDIIRRTQQAVMSALVQPVSSPEQRIAGAIEAMIRAYVEDSRCARVGVLEAVGVSPKMEKRRREVIHEFAKVIEGYADHLAQTGVLPKRNYHLLSVAMVGGTNELLAEWLTVENPPSIGTLTEEIQLLFRASILGGTAILNESAR